MKRRKFDTLIKNYNSKEEADRDSKEMSKDNWFWFTGWYTVNGFSVDYHRYIT